MKGKRRFSKNLFNNKVHNWLILYLQSQKRNVSNRISNLKQPWTNINLKEIQSMFHPDQLHSRCRFPKEAVEYFSKRLKNVRDKYDKHGEDDS